MSDLRDQIAAIIDEIADCDVDYARDYADRVLALPDVRTAMFSPRIPTPEMIAAAWNVIDREKKSSGIAKLGPGLGVREIWQAMFDARATQGSAPDAK